MSSMSKKIRFSFRPTVGEARLEERVVLTGTTASIAAAATRVAPLQTNASTEGGFSGMTLQQIRRAYNQQFTAAQTALRKFAANQITALYNDPAGFGLNGRPTQAALATLNANISGAANAASLQLSTQFSLLPASARSLVPNLQNSLLGTQKNSLASQISNVTNSSRLTNSQSALRNAVSQGINTTFNNNRAQLANFFDTTSLNRLSVDQSTGQRIPLQQFLNNGAVSRINNAFGTLANSVGAVAQSSLFDSTGTFNPQAVNGFQQQFSNALGTAASQVGSILSLLPNKSPTFGPQFQQALFAAGTDPATGQPANSLLNGLGGAFPKATGTGTGTGTPFTSNMFNTNFQNNFTTGFQNVSGLVNNAFGVQTTPGSTGNFTLPNGFFQTGATFPNLFGSQFTSGNFANGFNNGFVTGQNAGNGFIGFGQAPTGFNNNFATGFNNFNSTLNQQFGFTQPNLGGTGTGTGLPTNGGTVTGGGGTGIPGSGGFFV